MSQFPHDDFAKSYLKEVLKGIGRAVPNRSLKAETRTADLWFRMKSKPSASARKALGLLGRIVVKDALIEVFRNAAPPVEIRNCKSKLSFLEVELIRRATRRGKSLREADLPILILLMPTCSLRIRRGFSVTPTPTPGVYKFPEMERTVLVVLHQLPKTKDTVWLRMLGRASFQQQAINDFVGMSAPAALTDTVTELLADYRAILEAQGRLTEEEEELIMNLSAAYQKKKQEWLEEGKEEGKKEGEREGKKEGIIQVALNLLQEGFTLDLIAKATKLSIAEIERLRSSLES